MNFSIYHVLGVCAPIVAFVLLFVIANVVGFLKEHWKKARLFIGVLIFDIILVATVMGGARFFIRYMQREDFSRCIVIAIWIACVEILLLYLRVEFLDKLLDKLQRGKDKEAAEALFSDAASVSNQSGNQSLRDYLEEPIHDFPWLRAYTEEENRRGLLALRELAQRIRTRRGQLLHCNYLFHIFTAQRALGMGQYSLACHELFDVVHFHQAPEVTALIYKMIEPYFDEVTPIEQAAKRTCCPHCGNPCHAEDRYCRFCGERLFKRFSELPEDLQKDIVKQTERFIDAYLQD